MRMIRAVTRKDLSKFNDELLRLGADLPKAWYAARHDARDGEIEEYSHGADPARTRMLSEAQHHQGRVQRLLMIRSMLE